MLKEILKLGFISSLGNVLSKGGVFFVSILLSHSLSVEDFASYSLIYNLTMLLGTVTAASFGVLITNQVSQNNASTLTLVKNRIAICFYISFFAALLMYFYIDFNGVSNIALSIFIFVTAFFYALESMLIGGLAGMLKFKLICFNNLIKTLIFMFLVFVFSQFFGLKGAIFSIAIYVIVGAILNYKPFIHESIDKQCVDSKTSIFYESLPLILTNIMVTGFIWGVNYYIYTDLTKQDSSFFSVILQISQMLLFIATSMSAPLLPMLNKVKSNRFEYLNLYVPTIIMGIVGVLLFKFEVFNKLYGNNIINSENNYMLGIIIFISVISVFKLSLFRKNIQVGKLYLSLINNSFWLFLVVFYVFCYGFNLHELLVAMLYAHVITVFTALYMYQKAKIIDIRTFKGYESYSFFIFLILIGWILS